MTHFENRFGFIGELSSFVFIGMTRMFGLSFVLLHLMSLSHLLNFSIWSFSFVLFGGEAIRKSWIFVLLLYWYNGISYPFPYLTLYLIFQVLLTSFRLYFSCGYFWVYSYFLFFSLLFPVVFKLHYFCFTRTCNIYVLLFCPCFHPYFSCRATVKCIHCSVFLPVSPVRSQLLEVCSLLEGFMITVIT